MIPSLRTQCPTAGCTQAAWKDFTYLSRSPLPVQCLTTLYHTVRSTAINLKRNSTRPGKIPSSSALQCPVSYTHLDVYKRQPEAHLLLNRRKAIAAGKGTTPAGFIINDPVPQVLCALVRKRQFVQIQRFPVRVTPNHPLSISPGNPWDRLQPPEIPLAFPFLPETDVYKRQ